MTTPRRAQPDDRKSAHTEHEIPEHDVSDPLETAVAHDTQIPAPDRERMLAALRALRRRTADRPRPTSG